MNEQLIREKAGKLFEDMDKHLQLFKRESYRDHFEAYGKLHAEFFGEIRSLLRELEDTEEDTELKKIADYVVEAALEKRKTFTSRLNREGEQLNLNMLVVVYVLPSICAIKEERAEELAEILCEAWNEAFRGTRIQPSDFQSIQDGFKTKLCYVTTAVCESLHKPMDCYELNLLKEYRDKELAKTEQGAELIHAYYDIAPTIVKRIDKSADAAETYHYIWENYLQPCVRLIEADQKEACKELYIQMVEELQEEYMVKYLH